MDNIQTDKEVERLIGMPEKAIEYYFRRDGVLTSQAGGARGGVSIGYSRKDILVLSVISELHKSGVSKCLIEEIIPKLNSIEKNWWDQNNDSFIGGRFYIVMHFKDLPIEKSFTFEYQQGCENITMTRQFPVTLIIDLEFLAKKIAREDVRIRYEEDTDSPLKAIITD